MSVRQKILYKSLLKLIYIILFYVLFISKPVWAEQVFKNQVFDQNIKTVLLHKDGFEMSEPIIQLNSNEKLMLSFDDLNDAKVKNFKYTIQHCDAQWKASDLIQTQYLQGYHEDYINEYEFSLNTTVPYIHYSLSFPNDYLKPILSGNYILKVYEEDVENLIFIKRFKIIDPKLNIEAKARPTQNYSRRDVQQEIGFSVFLNNYYVQNPENDLKIIVQQNNRQDNLVDQLKPVRNLGQELDYHFNQKSIFEGGNEFRNFDIKSLRYRTEYVQHIEFADGIHHIYLRPEEIRGQHVYKYEEDINGKFIIRNSDGDTHEIEADYCWVHFYLAHPFEYKNSEIYILGELSNWQFEADNRMIYNPQKKGYECDLLLKQGYYNYLYIIKNTPSKKASLQVLEGNHYETNNEYTISIYHNEPGSYYDQLIGYLKFSVPNK